MKQSSQEETNVNEEPAKQEQEPLPQQPSSNKDVVSTKILKIGISLLAIMIVGVVLYIVMRSTSDDSSLPTLDTATQSRSESTANASSAPLNVEDCGGKEQPLAAYIDEMSIACDETYMYIEANSLADHEMMVGITAWNGQVPLPQLFVDDNRWKIPLNPSFNETTTETTGQGPIAVAINGVMIFNPTQQSGVYSLQTDPNLIGELDSCGGHSGRGDDYHYHVSPVCLEDEQLIIDQNFSGVVAYAMDGYPIYSNNAIPNDAKLDECNGLGDNADEYRYYATDNYPYVNGCFRGDFDMSLQPHAPSIRDVESGSPKEVLITLLDVDLEGTSRMEYEVGSTTRAINYTVVGEDCFNFEFIDDISTNAVRSSTQYCRDSSTDGAPPVNNDTSRPATPN